MIHLAAVGVLLGVCDTQARQAHLWHWCDLATCVYSTVPFARVNPHPSLATTSPRALQHELEARGALVTDARPEDGYLAASLPIEGASLPWFGRQLRSPFDLLVRGGEQHTRAPEAALEEQPRSTPATAGFATNPLPGERGSTRTSSGELNTQQPGTQQTLQVQPHPAGRSLASGAAPVGAVTSTENLDVDDLQFVLREDGVALFRSQARQFHADPPFCLRAGCVSGPSNRGRLEDLRDALGWGVMETDEDKQWVQIMLH